MERAKQAVESFVGRTGQHKTTVDEQVEAPVTHEQIKPQRHEEVTTAVNKEVHQDHHHTVVQPLEDRQVLPEKHKHNVVGVEHKTFEHNNDQATRDRLAREAAQFKDESVVHKTQHSASVAPTMVGENTHHHVHEHVQPVIHKETIQPEVVHTTVPIHEVHHQEAVHHGTTTLPPKSLGEYSREKGGAVGAVGLHKVGEFEGCPKPYDERYQSGRAEGDRDMHLHQHEGAAATGFGAAGAAAGAGALAGGRKHRTRTGRSGSASSSASSSDEESRRTGVRSSGRTHGAGAGGLGAGAGAAGVGHSGVGHSGVGHSGVGHSGAGQGVVGQEKKPSLLDKLNPMKDADHDGKKGLMD